VSTLPTLLDSGKSTASAAAQSPVPAAEPLPRHDSGSHAVEPPQPSALLPALRPPCPSIVHGEPLTDRKSALLWPATIYSLLAGKFIAHVARVSAAEEIQQVLQEIRADRAYDGALHHISAVRLRPGPGKPLVRNLCKIPAHVCQQNSLRDDDGETGAGDKLLFMLDQMKLENVLIVYDTLALFFRCSLPLLAEP
jgi:hypothetical protein